MASEFGELEKKYRCVEENDEIHRGNFGTIGMKSNEMKCMESRVKTRKNESNVLLSLRQMARAVKARSMQFRHHSLSF